MTPKVIASGISRILGLGIDCTPVSTQSKRDVPSGPSAELFARKEGIEVLGELVMMAMASDFLGFELVRVGRGGKIEISILYLRIYYLFT